MAAARGEREPPAILKMTWHVMRWHALPNAGGLLDQPAGLLDKMTFVSSLYQAARGKWMAEDSALWAEKNPDAWELYAWARMIEREHGNRTA